MLIRPFFVLLTFAGTVFAQEQRPFAIEVVDAQTGRGVPLVELKTVHQLQFFTDSAGLVAFNEPGLMNRDVFFHVFSHGYEFPADGFGIRGKAVRVTPGGSGTIKINRKNIAERLYRVTGEGIYRDTVLLGRKAPVEDPLLNGRVLGQDSVLTAIYNGKIRWFWGDTNRESYPLGMFHTSGATSLLPKDGGLDPAVGVNLKYFVDKDGFSRKMAPRSEQGTVWLDGLMVVKDDAGTSGASGAAGVSGGERMLARYSRMKTLGERLEHGLMLYNDSSDSFEKVAEYEKNAKAVPQGQPFIAEDAGVSYYYFASPYPLLRVKADFKSVQDLSQYESFTCLKEGTRHDKYNPVIDRDADGKIRWGWKKKTDLMDETRQKELIAGKHITAEEAWIDLRDVETKKQINAHGGTVAWNAHRKKYIAIWLQIYGTSMLGEVWYSEAPSPHGPFRLARKIVTHEKYSFYNPRHHPFFDQKGGKIIYFEGTYNELISGAKQATPRYDYNQIMYRLDLDDARLKLD